MTILEKMEWYLPEPYDNPQGVEFSGNFENFITVACNWPEFIQDENIIVDFMYQTADMNAFLKDFRIKRFKRIDEIKPEELMLMYHEGKAVVTCSKIDVNYFCTLDFLKKRNRLFATTFEREEHEVLESLETPEDFFEYSRIYFLIH